MLLKVFAPQGVILAFTMLVCRRFNDAKESCYGISEEEYRQAYVTATGKQPPVSIQRVFRPSAAPSDSVALRGFSGKHSNAVDELAFVFTGTAEV